MIRELKRIWLPYFCPELISEFREKRIQIILVFYTIMVYNENAGVEAEFNLR